MMVCKRYLLSNMAILGYVRFPKCIPKCGTVDMKAHVGISSPAVYNCYKSCKYGHFGYQFVRFRGPYPKFPAGSSKELKLTAPLWVHPPKTSLKSILVIRGPIFMGKKITNYGVGL